MYDPKTGAYYDGIEPFPKQGNYEFDSIYYLKYNSSKALYAIDKLKSNYQDSVEKTCFFYHVYLDLLFESVGLIINRFKPQRTANTCLRNQAAIITKEFDFSKTNYPLLNDKAFRNFIEHMDEKMSALIDVGNYYGTFNLIYCGMDEETRKNLLDDNKKQNNILNLESMEYRIIFYDQSNTYTEKNIKIIELEKEIEAINELSKKIWSLMNSNY